MITLGLYRKSRPVVLTEPWQRVGDGGIFFAYNTPRERTEDAAFERRFERLGPRFRERAVLRRIRHFERRHVPKKSTKIKIGLPVVVRKILGEEDVLEITSVVSERLLSR